MTRSRSKTYTRRFRTFSLCGVLIVCLMGVFLCPQTAYAATSETYLDTAGRFNVFSGGSIWYDDNGGVFTFSYNSSTFLFGLNYSNSAGNLIDPRLLDKNFYEFSKISFVFDITVLNDEGFDEPNRRKITPAFRLTDAYGKSCSISWESGWSGNRYPDYMLYSQDAYFTQAPEEIENAVYNVEFAISAYPELNRLNSEDLLSVTATNFLAVGDPTVDFTFRINSLKVIYEYEDTRMQTTVNKIENILIQSDSELKADLEDKRDYINDLLATGMSFDEAVKIWLNDIFNENPDTQDPIGIFPAITSYFGSEAFTDLFNYFVGLSPGSSGAGDLSYLTRPFIICGLLFCFISFLLRR